MSNNSNAHSLLTNPHQKPEILSVQLSDPSHVDTKQIACPLAGFSADLFPVSLFLNYKLSENTEGNDCNSSIMFTKGKCKNQLRMRGYIKTLIISSNICSYKNSKVHI